MFGYTSFLAPWGLGAHIKQLCAVRTWATSTSWQAVTQSQQKRKVKAEYGHTVTPTLRFQPRALHSDSTSPTHKHAVTPSSRLNAMQYEDKMVAIWGRGRLELSRIDRRAYVSDLVLLLACHRCAGPDAEAARCQAEEGVNSTEVPVNYLDVGFLWDLLTCVQTDSRRSWLVSMKKCLCWVCDVTSPAWCLCKLHGWKRREWHMTAMRNLLLTEFLWLCFSNWKESLIFKSVNLFQFE